MKTAEQLLHDAHLRYQRDVIRSRRDKQTDSYAYLQCIPSLEVRNVNRIAGKSETNASARRALYWTMALPSQRPNFYKAYIETLIYMSKP